MVELQSCSASLVNASSALSAIEKQEVKVDNNVINGVIFAEISAELQRERQKNVELLEKISFLEAQLQLRDNQSLSAPPQQGEEETSLRKFKRQKTKVVTDNEEAIKSEDDSEKKNVNKCLTLVNWMSMDEGQISQNEKRKDGESTADCDDTDDSDDEDVGIDQKCHVFELNNDRREVENIRDYKVKPENVISFCNVMNCDTVSANISNAKKPPKVAFCPREVKRIVESEALQQCNAQSHTIRKIIVFASLGIRHGCEDMYELDFNHFNILRKGEPYESPTNPGEHVVYENPRYRRKVFYPNNQNPTLCPVRILEEEKAMRPSDSSCPSCLFLCIKYGGRTRNLPQNEYVRQRMGRNKLKSFGPLICRTAMLVHIRSGSFFFKALGITLLFMAGFPDDLVQRETKYRNLDLLQKYYRTDEEAQGEELFLQHPIIKACDISLSQASPSSQQFTTKHVQTKAKSKKQSKPQQNKPLILQQPFNNFQLNSVTSQPQTPITINNSFSIPNLSNVSYQYHHMFPNQAPMYWPNPHYHNGFRSFPSFGSYFSMYPQPYNYARHVSGGHSISLNHENCGGKRKEPESERCDSSSSSAKAREDK